MTKIPCVIKDRNDHREMMVLWESGRQICGLQLHKYAGREMALQLLIKISKAYIAGKVDKAEQGLYKFRDDIVRDEPKYLAPAAQPSADDPAAVQQKRHRLSGKQALDPTGEETKEEKSRRRRRRARLALTEQRRQRGSQRRKRRRGRRRASRQRTRRKNKRGRASEGERRGSRRPQRSRRRCYRSPAQQQQR